VAKVGTRFEIVHNMAQIRDIFQGGSIPLTTVVVSGQLLHCRVHLVLVVSVNCSINKLQDRLADEDTWLAFDWDINRT
jgi:hypothetical protein